jgi:hypothetical protein
MGRAEIHLAAGVRWHVVGCSSTPIDVNDILSDYFSTQPFSFRLDPPPLGGGGAGGVGGGGGD